MNEQRLQMKIDTLLFREVGENDATLLRSLPKSQDNAMQEIFAE